LIYKTYAKLVEGVRISALCMSGATNSFSQVLRDYLQGMWDNNKVREIVNRTPSKLIYEFILSRMLFKESRRHW